MNALGCTSPHSPPPDRYPLAIIGAGALGLHFAARLAEVMPVAVIADSARAIPSGRSEVGLGESAG